MWPPAKSLWFYQSASLLVLFLMVRVHLRVEYLGPPFKIWRSEAQILQDKCSFFTLLQYS